MIIAKSIQFKNVSVFDMPDIGTPCEDIDC